MAVLRAKPIPEGSTLFAKIGEAIRHNHRVVAGRSVLIDNNAMAAIPRTPQVHPRYLFRFLQTVDFYPLTTSTTVPALRKSVLEKVMVPLPPIDEQRRIAAILDYADAIRSKRGQTLAHLDEFSKSLFLDMFGGPSASLLSVEEIASRAKGAIRTGPFGSQLLHSEFVDNGIAVLGIDNVVTNRFQWSERRYITPAKYEKLKRYTVAPGDVLITIMATCGRCVVVPDDIPTAINTKHICAITVDRDKVLPEFLRACFLWHPESQRFLLRRAKGSVMDGLNMGIIKEMPMPMPSLRLQREFVRRLRVTEAQRELAGHAASTLAS